MTVTGITGAIKCWGDGLSGAIGSGIDPVLATPSKVNGLWYDFPPATPPVAAPKGDLRPTYKAGKVKKRLRRYWARSR